ncbi:MAG: cytochrome C biogenesis protein [Rubrivivax sp. SCN 70-15]|nr:MAG: cytochrome C biogenesis protein [Rubrivivax sp. SCN 70-15]
MDFGPGTYLLGYVAGVLSTLSPCVLALLPIVVAAALAEHRHGPLALAAGLTVSFTAVGLFVATIGLATGVDQGPLRKGAAVLMIVFGAFLLSARLQQRFAQAAAGLGNAGDGLIARLHPKGWSGQFAIGLLLGLVWAPCSGPTLGAAVTLATQGTQLAQAAILMALFGLGAATPLLAVGQLSAATLNRLRGRLVAAGTTGRRLLGAVLLGIGTAIVTGLDKSVEAWLLRLAPKWLEELSTRF